MDHYAATTSRHCTRMTYCYFERLRRVYRKQKLGVYEVLLVWRLHLQYTVYTYIHDKGLNAILIQQNKREENVGEACCLASFVMHIRSSETVSSFAKSKSSYCFDLLAAARPALLNHFFVGCEIEIDARLLALNHSCFPALFLKYRKCALRILDLGFIFRISQRFGHCV